jgi:hypothetical protein
LTSTRPTDNITAEAFYNSITPALFESRLLDAGGDYDTFNSWYIRKYHGADKFWHSYLAYRVRDETDTVVGRLVKVRRVAECLQSYTGPEHDLNSIIDSLCWIALEEGSAVPGSKSTWASHHGRIDEPSNLGSYLLSASAYLGCTPLVRDLLRQGYCPTRDNDTFPSAMHLAAWAGRGDMLELLQGSLPEYEEFDPSRHLNGWRGKVDPGSVEGAAARGDLDVVRLAVYPPSRTVTSAEDSTHVVGQKPGHIQGHSKVGYCLSRGMQSTRSWDVYQYLGRLFEPGQGDDINFRLVFHARSGNVDMVRHLLDAGADVVGREMP